MYPPSSVACSCVSIVKLDGEVDGAIVKGCYDRASRVTNKQEKRSRSKHAPFIKFTPDEPLIDVMHIRIPIS
jgi:hypothetical protein